MSDDDSTKWLETLEAAVHQAAETIERLRTERDELAARVEELESAGGQSQDEGAEAWREERKEIRKRVEKLTSRLEDLLEED